MPRRITAACLMAALLTPAALHAQGPVIPSHEQELLERHKPVLVILPEESSRRSPGSWRAGPEGRGDYHPQAIEEFLVRAHLGEKPSGVLGTLAAMYRSLAPGAFRPKPLTGEAEIRAAIERGTEGELETKVLELAETKSQDRRANWRAFSQYLLKRKRTSNGVTYGRVVNRGGTTYLQYWLFYPYNDFRNKHEADFEGVMVRLDKTGRPAELALTAHHGGFRVGWEHLAEVDRAPPPAPPGWRMGERPVVYVARGSHANYATFREGGHRLIELKTKGLPARIVKAIQDLPVLNLLSRDRPPAAPLELGLDPNARAQRGVILDRMEVRQFEPLIQKFNGFFGSQDPGLLMGALGIKGPWATSRWSHPERFFAGARDLAADRVSRIRAAFRGVGRLLPEQRRARLRTYLSSLREGRAVRGRQRTSTPSSGTSGFVGVLGKKGNRAARRGRTKGHTIRR